MLSSARKSAARTRARGLAALVATLACSCGPSPAPAQEPTHAPRVPTTQPTSDKGLVLVTDYHDLVVPTPRGWSTAIRSYLIHERATLSLDSDHTIAALTIHQDTATRIADIVGRRDDQTWRWEHRRHDLEFRGSAVRRDPILTLTFHGRAEGAAREIELTCTAPDLLSYLRCEVTTSYWPGVHKYRAAWLFDLDDHEVRFTGVLDFRPTR